MTIINGALVIQFPWFPLAGWKMHRQDHDFQSGVGIVKFARLQCSQSRSPSSTLSHPFWGGREKFPAKIDTRKLAPTHSNLSNLEHLVPVAQWHHLFSNWLFGSDRRQPTCWFQFSPHNPQNVIVFVFFLLYFICLITPPPVLWVPWSLVPTWLVHQLSQ